MMTLKYTLFLLFILFTTNIFSQNENKPDKILPHHYKTKSFSALLLTTEHGYGAKVSFGRVSCSNKISTFSLGYDGGEMEAKTHYGNLFIDYVHFYKLININDKVFVNIGPGAYSALEMQRNDILDKKHSSFGLGFSGNAEIEVYMNKFAILGGFDQLYKPVTDIGTWQYRLSLGLRYIFR